MALLTTMLSPYTATVDPFHGSGTEAHNIILIHGSAVDRQTFVAISWPSIHLCGADKVREFIQGLQKAVDLAERMERDGGIFGETTERLLRVVK